MTHPDPAQVQAAVERLRGFLTYKHNGVNPTDLYTVLDSHAAQAAEILALRADVERERVRAEGAEAALITCIVPLEAQRLAGYWPGLSTDTWEAIVEATKATRAWSMRRTHVAAHQQQAPVTAGGEG